MTPIQLVKVSDEGSSSPFIARLFLGMLHFRDQLYLLGVQEPKRQEALSHFDLMFQPLIDATQATRDAASEIIELTKSHQDEVTSGRVVEFRKGQYTILRSIDSKLSQAVYKLLNQGIIATKTALQSILKDPLNLDIGFFFQQDPRFNTGISNLRSSGENQLASYLDDTRRIWHSDLQELRSKHEHHGWSLDQVKYSLIAPSQVAVFLPDVLGSPVDVFSRQAANRVLLFVENMMVHAMQRNSSLPIFFVEIPSHRRNPEDPQRFQLAPRGLDKSTPWELTYQEDSDFV